MILILTQCFPSRVGGIESLVSNLALELAKTEKVLVFADQHNIFLDSIYDNQNKNRIIIRRTSGIKFFRRRKKINEIKKIADLNKIKLIIADSWKSLELGIDFFNLKNIPSICLAHGNDLIPDNEKKGNRMKITLSKANSIICNSSFTTGLVKKLLPNNENINFIYPGANDLRNKISDNFINIKGKPVLITLSRLEKRKGHESILIAVKELVSKFPNLTYIIAGDGPEKQNLQKIIKQYSLESNVSLVGFVNDEQKKYLFENSDLMVMPTLNEVKSRSIEGFGIAYLEAAFFGIPSIASDVGGTKEAVLNNQTGIILDNINNLYLTIYDLLTNEEMRKKLGIEAQKRAEKDFNWNNIAKKYLKTNINKL